MNLSLTAYQAQAAQMLRALKGAPLACLHALHLMHPRPLGRADLVYLTDWNKDAVTKAMAILVNVYFLAARVGRYESWCLTDKGKQLQLPAISGVLENPDARALGEGDFSALPPVVGGGVFIENNSSFLSNTPTTTPEREDDFSALAQKTPEPLPENLTELFSGVLLGCPQTFAETAMRAALAADWSAAQIECELTLWVLYVESPLGRGIDLPPARFAAAKVKKLEKSPDFFHRKNRNDRQYGGAWERWESANDDRIRRAKKLLNEVYGYTLDTRFD